MSNIFLTDNFDSEISGVLPAWFTAVVGMWESVAGGSLAYSAPNILFNTSHTDGDILVVMGGSGVSIPATTDMGLTYVSKSFDGTGNGFTPLVRYSGANGSENWYGFQIVGNPSASDFGFQLYKCISGSIVSVGSQVAVSGISWSAGTALAFKIAAIGSTISGKVWLAGSTEPGSYQVNVTDTSLDTAGYAGFRYASGGGTSGNGIDNLQVFGNSSLIAGSISSSGITASSATLNAAAATGGTSPYTYQWYRSSTSGFVPQTSNAESGATSLTLNDSGLTTATT